METHELLQRLSATLRSDIGPAVADEYTRTQAFMASVILERLSKQVALASEHQAGARADLVALQSELGRLVTATSPPATLVAAIDEAAKVGTIAALGPVIEAIYGWGPDRPEGAEALDLIRAVLRRDIDRRMAVAT